MDDFALELQGDANKSKKFFSSKNLNFRPPSLPYTFLPVQVPSIPSREVLDLNCCTLYICTSSMSQWNSNKSNTKWQQSPYFILTNFLTLLASECKKSYNLLKGVKILCSIIYRVSPNSMTIFIGVIEGGLKFKFFEEKNFFDLFASP